MSYWNIQWVEKAEKIEQEGENSSVQLRESLEVHPELKIWEGPGRKMN